jgi:hypothetical protein
MRGTIALQKHFVRSTLKAPRLFSRSFRSAHASSRRFSTATFFAEIGDN